MQNPFQTCGNCKFCFRSIWESHPGILNDMKKSSQDFIAYIKNNRHREQEVLTTQKLVKQLCHSLLFKKQFALSRKGKVI